MGETRAPPPASPGCAPSMRSGRARAAAHQLRLAAEGSRPRGDSGWRRRRRKPMRLVRGGCRAGGSGRGIPEAQTAVAVFGCAEAGFPGTPGRCLSCSHAPPRTRGRDVRALPGPLQGTRLGAGPHRQLPVGDCLIPHSLSTSLSRTEKQKQWALVTWPQVLSAVP